MVALSASRFVCPAMLWIKLTTSPISCTASVERGPCAHWSDRLPSPSARPIPPPARPGGRSRRSRRSSARPRSRRRSCWRRPRSRSSPAEPVRSDVAARSSTAPGRDRSERRRALARQVCSSASRACRGNFEFRFRSRRAAAPARPARALLRSTSMRSCDVVMRADPELAALDRPVDHRDGAAVRRLHDAARWPVHCARRVQNFARGTSPVSIVERCRSGMRGA